ncbi:MAG: methyltransferase domain-containing protein [Planctomycetota bacterium]
MATKRVWTKELMDDPAIDREQLDRALGYIRAINRRLGGVSALLRHLQLWSLRWPKDRRITMLDLGTGSADLPVAARNWAVQNGFDLWITGVDNHAGTLDAARRHAADTEGVDLVEADALTIGDTYGPGSFDYVHAGLFLHHMPSDEEVVRVLSMMHRLARAGIVWNDLVRTRLGMVAINMMTVGQPEMIKHDARVSVRAGFTRREARLLAEQAGIDYASYRWRVFTHRFTIAGERPGAWVESPAGAP